MSLYDRIRRSRTLPHVVEHRQNLVDRIISESAPLVSPYRFMEAEEQEKTLRIMVAPPGAGKNTHIDKHYAGSSVHSADEFPGLYSEPKTPGGQPEIDFEKLPDAHQWTQKNANEAMSKGHPHVVINNTNTAAWQVAPYLKMAAKHGYKVNFTHLHAPLEDIRARGKHFPREKPEKAEDDRLAMMKKGADDFASKLHSLKDHPAPMRQLDKEGAFHAPWEDTPEKQQDHSDLHHLNYDIESHDTSSKLRDAS